MIPNFANPQFLFLLLLLPLVAWWYWRTYRKRAATIRYSNLELLKNLPRPSNYGPRHLQFALRLIALALVIVALARPQSGHTEE